MNRFRALNMMAGSGGRTGSLSISDGGLRNEGEFVVDTTWKRGFSGDAVGLALSKMSNATGVEVVQMSRQAAQCEGVTVVVVCSLQLRQRDTRLEAVKLSCGSLAGNPARQGR